MHLATVGIAQARNNLSTLINNVAYSDKRIILQSRGKPKAVIISVRDFQKLEGLDKGVSRGAGQLEILKRAEMLQERILRRRKGKVLSDSSELLHELRKERNGG
ncbi:type II toxin-antitoxin system Phd/YefM family antitoxin [bacterium]|nr:type II toxin-antitoxin system Phd/YefM family antitoxin [bacterium]